MSKICNNPECKNRYRTNEFPYCNVHFLYGHRMIAKSNGQKLCVGNCKPKVYLNLDNGSHFCLECKDDYDNQVSQFITENQYYLLSELDKSEYQKCSRCSIISPVKNNIDKSGKRVKQCIICRTKTAIQDYNRFDKRCRDYGDYERNRRDKTKRKEWK